MPSTNKTETATNDPDMVLSLTGLKTVSHAKTPHGTMTEMWGSPSLLLTSPQTWVSGAKAQFQTPQKSPSPKRRITRRSSVYVKIDQAAKKLPSTSSPTDKCTKFKVPLTDAGNSTVRRSRRSSVYRRASKDDDSVLLQIAKAASLSLADSKKVLKIGKKSLTSVSSPLKPPNSTISSRKRNLPEQEREESPEKPVPKRRRKDISLITPQADEYIVNTSQLSVVKKTQKVLPGKRQKQKPESKKSLCRPASGNIKLSIAGSRTLVSETDEPRRRERKPKITPQSTEDNAAIVYAVNSKQSAKTTKRRPTKYRTQTIRKMTDKTEIESLQSFKRSSMGRSASNMRKSTGTSKQLSELKDLPDASKLAQKGAMEDKFQSVTSSTFKRERSNFSSHRSPVDERILDILRAAAIDLSALKNSEKVSTPRSTKSIKKSVKSSLAQNKSSLEKEASKKTKSTFIHTASTPTHAPIAARKRLLSPLSLVKNYAPVHYYEPTKGDNLPGPGMLDDSSNSVSLDSKDVLNSTVSTSSYSSRCAIL